MCQYSSEDGFANDWHLVHLGSRAVGGAGLVMAEATAVSPIGRITPWDLGIWKEEHVPSLKRVTTFIEQQGAIPGIQLAHAGRKASHRQPWNGGEFMPIEEGGWTTIAPSAIPFKKGEPPPSAMNLNDIKKVVLEFTSATVRALRAGFKVVEIHAAHGYLLHEFLSPLTNKRDDEYGGSFESRTRLLREVTLAVRNQWPASLPLFVRISATDWVEGGWTLDESVALSKELKSMGVDLVDCSSGGIITGVKINTLPLYQVPFAERIKKEAGVMTAAVGLITTAAEGESIISTEKADLVFMARQMLRDPYFVLHAAREHAVDVSWPPQYDRAKN